MIEFFVHRGNIIMKTINTKGFIDKQKNYVTYVSMWLNTN